MKLLLERWNKFVNEAEEEESSSVSYDKMISLIKGEGGSELTINIDVPKGKKKGFGATKKRPVPFDYGEFPDYINGADKMGWDLIIAPSESTGKKGLRKAGNLLPVGLVKYKEDSGKKGNDKIVMASGGKISEEDKEALKVFFAKMSHRFEVPRFSESLSKDLPPDEMQKTLAWAELSGEGEFLARGTMGPAYRFGDKALKLTKDASEAYASILMIGKEHPNVATTYKVGKREGKVEFPYVIIAEFLQPAGEATFLVAKDMYDAVRGGYGLGKKFYAWKGIDALDEMETQRLNAMVSFSPEKFREDMKIRLDEIASGMTFLKENGVIYTDIKPSNIMLKNGKAAIIDLGRSSVNGYPQIEIIK
jgi:hypothetical protein